jgi:hypothetical protein
MLHVTNFGWLDMIATALAAVTVNAGAGESQTQDDSYIHEVVSEDERELAAFCFSQGQVARCYMLRTVVGWTIFVRFHGLVPSSGVGRP